MAKIRFLTDEAALLAGKSLVIADIHLGIEREFFQSGIKIPSQTEKIIKRIDDLISDTHPASLILLGDVKHKVPGISFQEMKEIPRFLEHFAAKADVHVVMGNHDSGIEGFSPPGVIIHPGSGFAVGDTYFCHGHAWPDEGFLSCRDIITGHRHPMVEFTDRLGYRFREPVWARGGLEADKLKKRYRNAGGEMPGLVIMPAFNGLSGGAAINRRLDAASERNFAGPLLKASSDKRVKIYLLDGTFLGGLADLKKKV